MEGFYISTLTLFPFLIPPLKFKKDKWVILFMSFDSKLPTLFYEVMREQFQEAWKENINEEFYLVQKSNAKAGDFFHETDSNVETTLKIAANIQTGRKMDAKLVKQGFFVQEDYRVYIEWDISLSNYDYARWNGKYWKIVNLEKSIYQNQTIFQQFGLKRVD